MKLEFFITLFFASSACAGEPSGTWVVIRPMAEDAFQSITDVDLTFLLSSPKVPWHGDPFLRKPGFHFVEDKNEKMVLDGIAWDREAPIAIINGKTVMVGQWVEESRVSEIGKTYVLLESGKSTIELSIYEDRTPASEAGDSAESKATSPVGQLIKKFGIPK